MANRDKQFWAAYTSFNQSRCCTAHNNLKKLRQQLIDNGAKEYAIFRQQQGFHSVLQQEYLVEHQNVQYWIDRGVPSHKEISNGKKEESSSKAS